MRKDPTWEPVERTVGPVPAWCRDAHVEWMLQYTNPPDIRVKTRGETWPDKVFRKDGERYIAEHPDGRAEMHVHDGALKLRPVEVFCRPDGTIAHERRWGPEWAEPGQDAGPEDGAWAEIPMLATNLQEGYGGRKFWITLDTGEQAILQGPWACGAPRGYQPIVTVDMDWADRNGGRAQEPWWKNLGCSGLALREDVFISVCARFLPHLPLARVHYDWARGHDVIEPYQEEWGEPKWFWQQRRKT